MIKSLNAVAGQSQGGVGFIVRSIKTDVVSFTVSSGTEDFQLNLPPADADGIVEIAIPDFPPDVESIEIAGIVYFEAASFNRSDLQVGEWFYDAINGILVIRVSESNAVGCAGWQEK